MSVKVSVKQLQKDLPEILNRAVADNDVCLIERNGEDIAVIVSLREWKRRTVGARLDALDTAQRMTANKQERAEALLDQKQLTRDEEKELAALLNEADEIMLRRAAALDNL